MKKNLLHLKYLEDKNPKQEGERQSSYNLRLRRIATDVCRFILPAATLTNVGVTMNARSWEHAIRKLLSSALAEENEIGEIIKTQAQAITPTLIKYADRNEYLVLSKNSNSLLSPGPRFDSSGDCQAILVHYDHSAESKLVASLLYEQSDRPYEDLFDTAQGMSYQEKESVINRALDHLGPHDIPIRQLETIDYTFDLTMDYGAYREFKRHRMQTYISQAATVNLGYVVPDLIKDSGLEKDFEQAMKVSADSYQAISQHFSHVGGYLVTHAHLRRVLAKINLRECYHLFKLRTSPQAHFTLRQVMTEAMTLASNQHPLLFKYLRLRTG